MALDNIQSGKGQLLLPHKILTKSPGHAGLF